MKNLTLSNWQKSKDHPGEVRHGDPKHLLECLQKYPERQLAACSAFLGGDDTPDIGPYCGGRENEIAKHALANRQKRFLILQHVEAGTGYAILVFFAGSCQPSFTDSTFWEMKWTSKSETAGCLQYLNFLGGSILSHWPTDERGAE